MNLHFPYATVDDAIVAIGSHIEQNKALLERATGSRELALERLVGEQSNHLEELKLIRDLQVFGLTVINAAGGQLFLEFFGAVGSVSVLPAEVTVVKVVAPPLKFAMSKPARWQLDCVSVLPELRRQGKATAFVKVIMETFAQRGEALMARVAPDEDVHIGHLEGWFRRLGWRNTIGEFRSTRFVDMVYIPGGI